MKTKLGVNIDHVATLRQARRASHPDPLDAAAIALSAGADYIVVHLRKDQRHIQLKDIADLCKLFPKQMHIECSVSPFTEKAVLKYKPHSVCIVPELPGEVTTTGGLKFTPAVQTQLSSMIRKLHKKNILVSLFIDPSAADLRIAKRLGADIVELCTRQYSKAKNAAEAKKMLQELSLAAFLAQELEMEVHAGHGLNYHNVLAVADIGGIRCMNIGFAIISRALFAGLPSAVEDMKNLL